LKLSGSRASRVIVRSDDATRPPLPYAASTESARKGGRRSATERGVSMRKSVWAGVAAFVMGISPLIFTSEVPAKPPTAKQCVDGGSRCIIACNTGAMPWEYCVTRCQKTEDYCVNRARDGDEFEWKRCGPTGGKDCFKADPCVDKPKRPAGCWDPTGGRPDGKSGQGVVSDPVRPPKPPVGAQPPAKGPQSTGTWTPPSPTPPPPASTVKDPAPKTPPARELLTKPFGGTYRP
jgi:hypothetical protein